MTHDERQLVRHLIWVVVLKLIVLAGLWWVFVRDQHVSPDAVTTAAHIAVPAPEQGAPR